MERENRRKLSEDYADALVNLAKYTVLICKTALNCSDMLLGNPYFLQKFSNEEIVQISEKSREISKLLEKINEWKKSVTLNDQFLINEQSGNEIDNLYEEAKASVGFFILKIDGINDFKPKTIN